MKKQQEDITEKIIEKQEQFLTSDTVLKAAGIKKSEMKKALYSKSTPDSKGLFNEAGTNTRRDIENHRNEYDNSDLEVLGTELVDNSFDDGASSVHVSADKKEETSKITFTDNGGGIKDFGAFLELGGDSKEDTTMETAGFAGQGAKLIVASVVTYGIAEVKREDGTVASILFFFNYAKNKIVYLPIRPKGRIKTTTGTYIEVNVLNEALDENPRHISNYFYDIYKTYYSVFLRENPSSIFVNSEPVTVEDYKDIINVENEYALKSRKGKIIISTSKLPTSKVLGFPLCICKRNIVHLDLYKDFGIDLPSDLRGRMTGFVCDDKLKTGRVNIVRPNKSSLFKNRKGKASTWLKFRKEVKNEIEDFLEKAGYLKDDDPIVFGEGKNLMNALNIDLKYAMKNNKLAKDIFSSLREPTGRDVNTTESHVNPSIPAHTKVRKGEGSITGVICHSNELESLGHDLYTPADKIIKSKEALFSKNEKSIVKVYQYIPGHPLIRLTDDVTVTGPYFTIDNVPLNTQLIIRAYTTYGNPSNQSEPFGRPATFVYLSKEKPKEKVVLPVTIQKGLNVTRAWKPARVEVGWVDNDEDGRKEIFYNAGHPLFKIGKKQGKRATYLALLQSVIYAVASHEEPDDKERVSKEILETIYRRL